MNPVEFMVGMFILFIIFGNVYIFLEYFARYRKAYHRLNYFDRTTWGVPEPITERWRLSQHGELFKTLPKVCPSCGKLLSKYYGQTNHLNEFDEPQTVWQVQGRYCSKGHYTYLQRVD